MWINRMNKRCVLSLPAKIPPGSKTRTTSRSNLSCNARDGTWCSMVNDTTAENCSSENGIAVASPVTISTLLPCHRERSALAESESSSRAVRRCTFGPISSVVRPGPGPNSRTLCPNATPDSAFDTRCATILLHRPDRHNQWCNRFTLTPPQSASSGSKLALQPAAYFRYCDNQCRKSVNRQFPTGCAIAAHRL